MKKGSIRQFLLNPYVSGILVGILLLFGASLYTSFISKIDFFKAVGFVATFGVPIWILVALFISYVVVSRLLANRPPAYARYVRDKIQDWTFRWQWERSKDGRITPVQLQAVCPDCDSPLMRTPTRTWCPSCNKTFPPLLGLEKHMSIQSIIVGNARKRNPTIFKSLRIDKTHIVEGELGGTIPLTALVS
ncbi:MAG: Sjogren's syndrome/scleroderma autoantigen 1 family protein [Spirochaetia bacterium]|jgi:hypothetical protein